MDPNLEDKTLIEDSGVELDLTEALADISSDLFGQGNAANGNEGKAPLEGEKSADLPMDQLTSPQTDEEKAAAAEAKAAAEANSAAVQDTGAPKTWTKEALAEWAKIPARAQAEILKREQDMFAGLEQYKGRAEIGDRYSKVAEPYMPALQAAGVDPVELFNNFAGNHYLLVQGTPEQKLHVAAGLMQHYGIDIPALINMIDSKATADPNIAPLQSRLEKLEQERAQERNYATEQMRQQKSQEVAAFAADPKNVYFSEVANDILSLIKGGVARTLQEAYDKAVYANPVTRQKELDRLTAERSADLTRQTEERAKANAAATAANITSKSKSASGTAPVGTLDDTLNETMSKIKARS